MHSVVSWAVELLFMLVLLPLEAAGAADTPIPVRAPLSTMCSIRALTLNVIRDDS